MDKSIEIKQYPEGDVPKATKVENVSSFLRITFDTGEIRYLRSHLYKDIVDVFSPWRWKRKGGLWMFGGPKAHYWLGSEFEIKETGEVILNGTDHYSPEELWYDSKEHIHEIKYT